MKKILVVALGLFVLLSFSGCKKSKSKSHHGGTKTKIVQVDDIQIAFDLMPLENYNKMLKQMKLPEEKGNSNSHALLLTPISKTVMRPVKGAAVSLTITGQDKQSKTIKTKVLEGGGMYHYGALLNVKGGHLVVSASIKTKDKSYSAKTTFDLQLK